MKKCQFCPKEFKNIKYHELYCKSNPNREIIVRPNNNTSHKWLESMKTRTVINGYMKAAENGTTYSLSDAARKRISVSSSNRKHSEETKNKISARRKKFIIENPDKAPYVLNHYTKGPSYAEQYFLKVFENTPFEYHYKFYTYELDFADVSRKINVEIDGEQHYCDNRIIKHDIKRNLFLESHGWSVIRIRWSNFCKLSERDKIKIINEIIVNGRLAQ